jgi:uncharacterized protein
VRRRAHPRIRGGLPARLVSLYFGLFLFGLGIVLILESKLGLSPWDVLHQGIAKHTPLSFGEANIAVGAATLVLGWLLGGHIGLGTFSNAGCVGAYVQGLTSIGGLATLAHWPLVARIGLLALGILVMGIGTAFYVGADFGAGPRDTLMLVASQRLGVRIGVARGGIELVALVGGILLGGHFGVGTFAFAFGIGVSVELAFWLIVLTPLATQASTHTPVVEGD